MARLRRPPVTAWALNRVARRRPELVGAVLDAGAGLRQAMQDALGGDPSALREARAAERRAVDAAVTAGAGVLEDAGRGATDAARLRMAASLRAAVVDPSVAELLGAGVLDADRDAPGFGLDGLSVPASPPAARRSTRPGGKAASRPGRGVPGDEVAADDDTGRGGAAGARAAGAERRRPGAEADEAEDRARRLEREAAEAERRAAQLEAAAKEAGEDAERATRRAAQLEQDARRAAEQAKTGRTEAGRAATRADEARRRATDT